MTGLLGGGHLLARDSADSGGMSEQPFTITQSQWGQPHPEREPVTGHGLAAFNL